MPIELLDISIARKPKAPQRRANHVVRRFEDGSIEIVDGNGRRQRLYSQVCPRCKQARPSSMFSLPPSDFMETEMRGFACRLCLIAEFEAQAAAQAAKIQAERRYRLEIGDTSAQRRAATLTLASPSWRDRLAIKAIYLEAKRLSLETGKKYDVDHIHPVMGCLSTGLHVHWNLQILEASVNRSKSDSFNLDESPAWGGISDSDFRREYTDMYREFMINEKNQLIDTGRQIGSKSACSQE